MSEAKTEPTRETRQALFAEAEALMSAECGRNLELGEVAFRVACSRRQLQRAFAETAATTFSEHLTRLRLERAAELLAEDRRPVAEVAAAVGYRSTSSFSMAFRRHHGVPPSAVRRRRSGER